MYLYKHNVIVVCMAVVLRVGHQKMGHDFLLCPLIDGQGVVSCYYHHFVYPAEIESKVKLLCCNAAIVPYLLNGLL